MKKKKREILNAVRLIMRRGLYMAKHTKKDGGTKQKGKHKPKHKTSGSANGQNGYH
jgi:hypothetical protein